LGPIRQKCQMFPQSSQAVEIWTASVINVLPNDSQVNVVQFTTDAKDTLCICRCQYSVQARNLFHCYWTTNKNNLKQQVSTEDESVLELLQTNTESILSGFICICSVHCGSLHGRRNQHFWPRGSFLWNHDKVLGYNEQLVEDLFIQYRNSVECSLSDQTLSHDIVSCVNVLHFFKEVTTNWE
jgi:hypothetical protein